MFLSTKIDPDGLQRRFFNNYPDVVFSTAILQYRSDFPVTSTLQLEQDPWHPKVSSTCPDDEFRTSKIPTATVSTTCTISWTVPVIIETNEKLFSFHNIQTIATIVSKRKYDVHSLFTFATI
mmetsp:Transcript_19322/g.43687  ORF Transcript_19322/g.43687 Transcript_19322/m.43687 type:complete len:122 (+) Transcript_19322:69-434(+)